MSFPRYSFTLNWNVIRMIIVVRINLLSGDVMLEKQFKLVAVVLGE